jgi:hypothetical protein
MLLFFVMDTYPQSFELFGSMLLAMSVYLQRGQRCMEGGWRDWGWESLSPNGQVLHN